MDRCLAKLIVALLVLGTSAALEDGQKRAPLPPRPSTQSTRHLNFLEKYGYFDHFGPKPKNAERSTEEVREAIESMQRFAGLPVTGEIDEKTAELMSKPRCGVKDILPRYNTGGSHFVWPKKNLKFTIVNYPSATNSPDMHESQAFWDLHDAFAPWGDVSALNFEFTWTASEAEIVMSFGSGVHSSVPAEPSFDGPGGVLAHAFLPNSGWGNMNGDVHFDDDETFTSGSDIHTNLFIVAAHEIGHALGMQHSDVPGALMVPYYVYQDNQGYVLPDDDKLGIQSLYGTN